MTYREMLATLRVVSADPRMAAHTAVIVGIAKRMSWAILLSEIVLVAQSYPVKWYFDGLLSQLPPSIMYPLCLGMLCAYFYGTSLHVRQQAYRSKFRGHVWSAMWGYSHLRELKLDTAWHVRHSTGDKESIIGRNAYKILMMTDEVVGNTIPSVMRIVLTSIIIWIFGLHVGGVAFFTLVGFLLELMRTERIMGPLRKVAHRQMRFLEREGTEITKTWRTLKQFGIEEDASLDHWRHMDEYLVDDFVRNDTFLRCWTRQENIVSLGRVLLYIACYRWYDPKAGLGSVVLVTAWMERIFSNLYRLDEFQRKLNDGREAAHELCEILQIVPAVRQPLHPLWPAGGIRGQFELRGVSFSFTGRSEDTLKDLNLTVNPNECLALIGRTGSGKTTLTSLLIHEYDPTCGTIFLDDVPLDHIDHDRYRSESISIVSQRIDLFDGSVTDNIRKACPSASFEEIVDAARKAHAHEFIMRLENGYDSMIGEDGITLSGGQRQRIAIARALLRKPPILIMDEATSSLDGESQAEVQKAIDQLIENRTSTIVVIAHRLSTIRQADRIVVMDEGRIVEVGTPAELAARGGLYRYFMDRELSDLQSQLEE